jgi:hypothetical protein
MIDLDAIFCDVLDSMMADLEAKAGRRLTSKEMHDISEKAFSVRDEIDEEFFDESFRRRLITKGQVRKGLGNIWQRRQ